MDGSAHVTDVAPAAAGASHVCLHCGEPALEGSQFCCPGCEAAHGIVQGLGLDSYYRRRELDPLAGSLKPEEDRAALDFDPALVQAADGSHTLHLMVEGLHCAACVWLIEQVLARHEDVIEARLNMTTRRLRVTWTGEASADAVLSDVLRLGYRLVPYDPAMLDREDEQAEKDLLRCMAVAGFAAGNVMLLSVAIWAGAAQDMDAVTRDLFHWISALICLPAIVYAGRPFFRSAFASLRHGRLNMDVPISLAVTLAGGMSLYETITGGSHAYFDSAVMLLFFLLVGRYLDRRARGRARGQAARLLSLTARPVTVLDADGTKRLVAADRVQAGDRLFVRPGETIGADAVVVDGISDVDASLITGESLPAAVTTGVQVYAGTANLSGVLVLEVTAGRDQSLLADIVQMMEDAEAAKGSYVVLADRLAKIYAPAVHTLAAVAFIGWWGFGGLPWQDALLIAVATLIITCPCALALAVPVVQVAASSKLFRQGVLVKSGSALERLADVTEVALDKTGTLTEGHLKLLNREEISGEDLRAAAALAHASSHPLSRALAAAAPDVAAATDVREVPGQGLEAGDARLGRRTFCGIASTDAEDGPELWFTRPGLASVHFRFADRMRSDTPETLDKLKRLGLPLTLLSGDREASVSRIARETGIKDHLSALTPADKRQWIGGRTDSGAKVLMVGDGLNDAPSLAAAHVSISPSDAADVSRTSADILFQGRRFAPVAVAVKTARRAKRLMLQNFAIALTYNCITVPMALAGMITPLLAALAMSASSLVVVLNALRLSRDG